jgi:hypothetical protein
MQIFRSLCQSSGSAILGLTFALVTFAHAAERWILGDLPSGQSHSPDWPAFGEMRPQGAEVQLLLCSQDVSWWWAQRDLNPRPSDYESPALTTELWAQPKGTYSARARIGGKLISAGMQRIIHHRACVLLAPHRPRPPAYQQTRHGRRARNLRVSTGHLWCSCCRSFARAGWFQPFFDELTTCSETKVSLELDRHRWLPCSWSMSWLSARCATPTSGLPRISAEIT